MKILYIFTDLFPTNPYAESFLANELSVASKYFDKVYFCPQKNDNAEFPHYKNLLSIPCEIINPPPTVIITKLDFLSKYLFRIISPLTFSRLIKAYFKGDSIKSLLIQLISAQIKKDYYIRKIEKKSSNRLFFYSYWFHGSALIAGQLAKHFNTKAISRAHRYDLYAFATKNSFELIHKQAIPLLSYVLPCSNDGTNYLINELPFAKSKIKTSYLGSIDNGVASWEKGEVFHIASCSFVVPVKRIEKIIYALYGIKDVKIHWTHLGEKRENDLWQKLHLLCNTFPQNISFEFKGAIENKAIFEFYKTHNVDLFVNVSESEGVPVSIMEALSVGIPVCASDVGGIHEMVENGINGFLLSPVDTSNDLSQKILFFNELKEENIIEFRHNARKSWEEKFNADKNYNTFYQIFEESNNA